MSQTKELRQSRRIPFQRKAWIELDGGERLLCSVHDVSNEGAQLKDVDLQTLPDEFGLRFTDDGAVARKCRLAWRDGARAGVAFVARRAFGGRRIDVNAPITPSELVEEEAGAHVRLDSVAEIDA